MPDHAERLRVHYGRRLQRYARSGTVDEECTVEAAEAFRRLRHETMTAERLALIGLRNDGTISDEVLHRLEHELDVEALRLGLGERRAATRRLECFPSKNRLAIKPVLGALDGCGAIIDPSYGHGCVAQSAPGGVARHLRHSSYVDAGHR